MKHFFAFLFMVLFLVGCASGIVVKEDPFKGTVNVSADMWHKVADHNTMVFDNQRFLYEKEIKNGKVSNPTAYFLFNLFVIPLYGYSGEDFEKTAYIVCDNKNFKANIIDYKNVERASVHGSGSTDAGGSYSAKVGTTHQCTVTGKIVLTPDMLQAISNCSDYMIRFYLVGSNIPVTVKATSGQLNAVKKFISVNASNIEKK